LASRYQSAVCVLNLTFFVNFAVFISTNAADTAFTYDLYELNVTRPDPETITWHDPTQNTNVIWHHWNTIRCTRL